MLMPQSMHICMRPYEDLQSYEKHLKNSTLSTQSQQLCSKRNNRGIYPHRETLGLQRPKKTKRIHGTVDSQNSLSSSLLNDSFLRRVGIPPGQAEKGTQSSGQQCSFHTCSVQGSLPSVPCSQRAKHRPSYQSPLLSWCYHHLHLMMCSIL